MKMYKKLLSFILSMLLIVCSFALPISISAEVSYDVAAVESLINAIGEVENSDAFVARLEAAEKAYNSLSKTDKSQVSNYLVLVNARDDYDTMRYTEAGWHFPQVFDFDDPSKTNISDYAELSEGANNLSNSAIENGTLKVASSGSKGTMLFDAYSNIATYSFDVKLFPKVHGQYSAHIIYYLNSETGAYSGIRIGYNNDEVWINPSRTDNYFQNSGSVRWNADITEDKWFTVKLTYGTEYATGKNSSYSPATVLSKYITNITVTDKVSGSEIASSDMTTASSIRYFAYGVDKSVDSAAKEPEKVKIGFRALHGNTIYVDNMSVTYNNAENAETYKLRYASLLNKDLNSVTSADKEIFDSALEVYSALKDSDKKLLSDEIATLISFTEIIYPNSFGLLNEYIANYGELLTKPNYASADLDALKNAFDAFEKLDNVAQTLVYSPYKINLDAALKYISENPTARNEDDLSSLDFDFEYFQNAFKLAEECADTAVISVAEIVADPTDPDNNVFAMQGKDFFYLIKDEYLPSGKGVRVSRFSLRFLCEDIESFTSPLFAYSYENKDNFYATTFARSTTSTKAHFESFFTLDNQYTRKRILTSSPVETGKWAELDFLIGDTTCTVTLIAGETVLSYTVDYVIGAQVALGFVAQYRKVSQMLYVDDIHLEFNKSDFDTNQKTNDITAYYHGNTFQNPNETVSLTGDSLYRNVQGAQLTVIENGGIDPSNPQYIFQESYDSSQVDEGIASNPTVPTWKSENAVDVEFVQKSNSTLKFILPKSTDKHIYALKINPSHLNAESKIRYINVPKIDFVMGDDGDEATRGGEIRIIGNNLYVDDGHSVLVVLKSIETGVCTSLTDLEFIEGDTYSVAAKIPSDFSTGKYEVYIHNGYGDNNCWSEPTLCTVKNISENKVWSSKGVFNVKDYGAVGDSTHNDTPAILEAMQAASENGGGTVYFPRGQYRVITTLAIPRNVTIEGESKSNTLIFWTADRWDYGEVPPLLSITGNVEIKNIYLYATRHSNVVYMNCDVPIKEYEFLFGDPTTEEHDNVYIDDVHFMGLFLEGNPTGGGISWYSTGEFSQAEMQSLVTAEAGAHKIFLQSGGKNYQISNYDSRLSAYAGYIMNISVNGSYVNINNVDLKTCSLSGIVRKAIIEDSDFREAHCVGLNGADMYFARCKFGYGDMNNREGYVSDGVPRYLDEKIQKIDSVTFKVISRTKFSMNQFAGMELYVASGQGAKQCRMIVSSETDGTIKINEPFIISPNRNSVVTIFEPRVRIKFVQNFFIECAANGSFGVMVDSIWAGNVFSQNMGQYFTPNRVFMWYTSVVDSIYKDPVYVHGDGVGKLPGGYLTENMIFLNINTVRRPNSFVATTIKNNTMDGYYIYIKGGMTNSIDSLVIEGNEISNVENGIYSESNSTVLDGVYIRNNSIDYSGYDIDPKLVNCEMGSYGYSRAIIVYAGMGDDNFLLGDVNLDGKITVKDCTTIIYYYLGMIELSEEQLVRADTNADNAYNLKDATRIKQHILYDVKLGKIDSNDEFYPGEW